MLISIQNQSRSGTFLRSDYYFNITAIQYVF